MNRYFRFLITGLVVLLGAAAALYLSGCAGVESKGAATASVSSAAVAEFQNTDVKQRTDIYIPITEQWKGSRHGNSLKDPIDSGHGTKECYACHSADYSYNNGKIPEMTEMKNPITCILCHKMTPAGYVLVESDRVKLCVKCHTAGQIKAGKAAHHAQGEVFMGKGAVGIPPVPNPKYENGVSCPDCHMPNQNHDFEALTPSAAEKENRGTICMMCHKNQDRQQFTAKIDKLQKDTEEKTKTLKSQLEQISKKLEAKKAAGQDTKALEGEYGIASTNASIVESDKSKGIHNPPYIKAILEDTQKRVTKLTAALQ